MESYQLVVSLFLFLGLMGVIALLDRRRRTELAHFSQIQQSMADCLQALQAHATQAANAASVISSAIEASTKIVSEDSGRAVKDAAHRMEAAVLQLQKSQEAASQSLATTLANATKTASKDSLDEAQKTTKAVRDLQASLEASVNFK